MRQFLLKGINDSRTDWENTHLAVGSFFLFSFCREEKYGAERPKKADKTWVNKS